MHIHCTCMVVDAQDLSVLQDLETIKQLGHILKTNVRACVAVGHPFVMQVHIHVYTCTCIQYTYMTVHCKCVVLCDYKCQCVCVHHVSCVSSQLGRIYLDMVNVYKVLSENISSAVSVSGKPTMHCHFLCSYTYTWSTHTRLHTCIIIQ